MTLSPLPLSRIGNANHREDEMTILFKAGLPGNAGGLRDVPGLLDSCGGISAEVLRGMGGRILERCYDRGQSIFLEEDPAESVWFVKQGHVKEVVHTVEGRGLILDMVGAGDMFGMGAFLGGAYGCHGVAETDAVVLPIPVPEFKKLLGKDSGLSWEVLSKVARRLRRCEEMQVFALESAEKRILHVLAELAGQFDGAIPLTRREIGEMAGTVVETTIRIFSRLERQGLVRAGRGQVAVRDGRGLFRRLQSLRAGK